MSPSLGTSLIRSASKFFGDGIIIHKNTRTSNTQSLGSFINNVSKTMISKIKKNFMTLIKEINYKLIISNTDKVKIKIDKKWNPKNHEY